MDPNTKLPEYQTGKSGSLKFHDQQIHRSTSPISPSAHQPISPCPLSASQQTDHQTALKTSQVRSPLGQGRVRESGSHGRARLPATNRELPSSAGLSLLRLFCRSLFSLYFAISHYILTIFSLSISCCLTREKSRSDRIVV